MTHVQARLGSRASSLGFVFAISVMALVLAAMALGMGLMRLADTDAHRDGGGTLSFVERSLR